MLAAVIQLLGQCIEIHALAVVEDIIPCKRSGPSPNAVCWAVKAEVLTEVMCKINALAAVDVGSRFLLKEVLSRSF